jgi:hypothetical protein
MIVRAPVDLLEAGAVAYLTSPPAERCEYIADLTEAFRLVVASEFPDASRAEITDSTHEFGTAVLARAHMKGRRKPSELVS